MEKGMDRTGEVSGSYYMAYLDWTFEQSLYYDDHEIENRTINIPNRNAMQWYCYYLQDNSFPNAANCSLPSFDNCSYRNCSSFSL